MNLESNKKLEKSVDRIFSFINILKITSNVSAFRKWLQEYHKINDDSKIFEGYRFFIDVCISGFINSIIYDDSLDINEDFTFFRARFVGVDIEDIPNTCDKIICEAFIKKFADDGSIIINEIIIDKKIFMEYLAEKSISSVFDEIKHQTPLGVYTEFSISEIETKKNTFIGNVKGKFFEYLFYNWLNEENKGKCETIRLDVLVNNGCI